MTMINYYIKVLQNYVNFSWRAQRAEYWFFFLVNLIIGFVLGFGNMFLSLYFLYVIYSLFVFLPSLAVSVRRLHDVWKSGWMLLILLIPFIWPIILLIFFVQDSQKWSNQYGPNPKSMGSWWEFSENYQQA